MQPVNVVLEPTCRGLWAGAQPVYVVSEPTSQGLWGRGATCLCGVGTSPPPPGTVGQVCSPGNMGQGCSLFKGCGNLSPRDCGAVVLPVYAVWEPTSRGLSGRGAACL